jgi:hypothetical protein
VPIEQNMTNPMRWSLPAAVATALVLSACGGGTSRTAGNAPGQTSGPVQLGRGLATGNSSVAGSLNDVEMRRAIENYRINMKRDEGAYQIAGADLNGDGLAEAVVLFAGKDWCANTGCSLSIFQTGQHGYTPISRTVRVKAPVVVSTAQTNGWRDLIVSTGGAGGAPLRRVTLRFTGSGYSPNAMQEEELPPDVPQLGETVIPDTPPPAQLSGAPRASNR